MKKRIVPELFRNNVYHNYFVLNSINFTKNTNSILLYQDFEIKRYIKDFFSQYKLDIQQIGIFRTYTQLNINLYYLNNLSFLKEYNETLFDKLNFYKFYTLNTLVAFDEFDIHTIVSKKIYLKSLKLKKQVDFIEETVYETFYTNKFFFWFNKKYKPKNIAYQYLQPCYSYLNKLSVFKLAVFQKEPPRVFIPGQKRKPSINKKFWRQFNFIKNVKFADMTGKLKWYNLLYSKPTYPFYKKPLYKEVPLTFLPSYYLKLKKKKQDLQSIKLRPFKFKPSKNEIILNWRKALTKKTDFERKNLIKSYLVKFKYFLKKLKNLKIFYKDYLNYLNLNNPISHIKKFKLIFPKFSFKILNVYKFFCQRFVRNLTKKTLKIKSFKIYKLVKSLIKKKFRLLLLLCLNLFKLNKYLYFKLAIRIFKN